MNCTYQLCTVCLVWPALHTYFVPIYYYILQFFIHTDSRYIIIGRRQNLNPDFDFRVLSTPSTYPNFSKNASCEGVNCPLNPIIIILQLTNQAKVAKIAVSYGRQAGYCLFLRQKCTLARFFDDELCYFRWESQHILLACKCIE